MHGYSGAATATAIMGATDSNSSMKRKNGTSVGMEGRHSDVDVVGTAGGESGGIEVDGKMSRCESGEIVNDTVDMKDSSGTTHQASSLPLPPPPPSTSPHSSAVVVDDSHPAGNTERIEQIDDVEMAVEVISGSVSEGVGGEEKQVNIP